MGWEFIKPTFTQLPRLLSFHVVCQSSLLVYSMAFPLEKNLFSSYLFSCSILNSLKTENKIKKCHNESSNSTRNTKHIAQNKPSTLTRFQDVLNISTSWRLKLEQLTQEWEMVHWSLNTLFPSENSCRWYLNPSVQRNRKMHPTAHQQTGMTSTDELHDLKSFPT